MIKTTKKSSGFSDFEKAAMKERAKELAVEARMNKNKAEGEKAVISAITKMPEPDRSMAKRIHEIVKVTAPGLFPKTWYGMPAYANKDGINEMYIATTDPDNKIFMVTGMSDISQMDSTDITLLYTIPVTSGGKFRSMYVADPDRDGNVDLMIGGESNGQIFSLEYKGTGNPADSSSWEHRVLYDAFVESGLSTISPRFFYGSPADDMDKDGNDEYVFVNYSPDYGTWPDDVPVRIIEIDRATGVRNNDITVPQGIMLVQNYPNPFNPTTTIACTVPVSGKATLTVYNELGQVVATLFDGVMEAGKIHRTPFDASRLAGGVYFARLTSGGQSHMRKLVLVK